RGAGYVPASRDIMNELRKRNSISAASGGKGFRKRNPETESNSRKRELLGTRASAGVLAGYGGDASRAGPV
ncbi:hypothetical protein, partial [Streptomyces cacaoi]|uniref:hypothetical protein n=1 Tax=Streptomyces cacaoi TaxID=1898 RepID=UPI0036FCEAE3